MISKITLISAFVSSNHQNDFFTQILILLFSDFTTLLCKLYVSTLSKKKVGWLNEP